MTRFVAGVARNRSARSRRALAGWALALSAGCAARSPAPGGAKLLPRASIQVPRLAPSASASSVASLPFAAPEAPPLEIRVEQELSVPVRSIALGEAGRVAVLADVPYLGHAHGLRALPLPNALRPKPEEIDDVRIFFGRDNEPRIMGSRRSSAGELSIYWRHTSSGWRDGREEIGQLGGTTRGGLWGVLGSADPELVCRVNSLCIIKRTSGWTSAPAGSVPRHVELLNGTLWGLDASGLATIDAHGWSVRMPAPEWSEPRAFWAGPGEAWVATVHELFQYRAGAWSEVKSCIAEPLAFWAARSDSIWMVGKGGAAHFDGHGWQRLSLAGPLNAVAGRADGELWFGGEAGLFRAPP